MADLAKQGGVRSIAIRTTNIGKCGGTIQVRAQTLRGEQGGPQAGTRSGFAPIADVDAGNADEADAERSSQSLEADVKRAVAAAQEAGLTDFRIEIAPDGTMTIVVCGPGSETDEPDHYGDLTNP